MSTSPQSTSPIKLPDSFFPRPSQSRNRLAPRRWPGVSAEAEREMADLLRKNNEHWHIYFNDRGFHNHLTHHLFAAFALGTKPNVLVAAYDLHAEYQKPAYKSPKPIDSSNWKACLGKWDYYNAFMHFYASEIERLGATQTLEKYVFSKDANLAPEGTLGPQMLSRFLGGLLHPLIHVGHWAEFDVPGMLAEGLASVSITTAKTPQLLPPDFFEWGSDGMTSLLSSLDITSEAQPAVSSGPGVHAFFILSRMLDDPELGPGKTCESHGYNMFEDTIKSAGERIRSYAKLWTITDPEAIPSKLEELAWVATLLYGLGGWRKGHAFRSDFYLFVTYSGGVGHIQFSSQSALLRGYLAVMLAHWVARGRPALPITDFYASYDEQALLPKALIIQPSKDAIGVDNKALPANPWMPIIDSALNHKDEHLIKNQRSLAHFDHCYGDRPKGYFKGRTELKGAEELDGKLFWMVALQTQKTLGWVREGEPMGDFDYAGLGWDGLWQ